MPAFGVEICTRDRWDDLPGTLPRLIKNSSPPARRAARSLTFAKNTLKLMAVAELAALA